MGFLTTILATVLYCALGYSGLVLFGTGDRFELPYAILQLIFVMVWVVHLLQVDSPAISKVRAAGAFLLLSPVGAIVAGLAFYLYAWITVLEHEITDTASLPGLSLQMGLAVGSVFLGTGLVCFFRAVLINLIQLADRDTSMRDHKKS
ncbi:MAG: hypothetical protein JWL63_1735 [Rhodocyclales bacterium]|nr:hypothetical protein [Rhodocyclales bacterium]